MSWRSGELVVTEGTSRNAELFVRHLDDLRCRFRHYKKVYVICDNARFHTVKGSLVVRQYLMEHGDRIVLHYLPSYSPQDNPIERVWWHLHEQITRNHHCQCIGELLDLTMAWLDEHGAFKIEGAMYQRLKAAAAWHFGGWSDSDPARSCASAESAGSRKTRQARAGRLTRRSRDRWSEPVVSLPPQLQGRSRRSGAWCRRLHTGC